MLSVKQSTKEQKGKNGKSCITSADKITLRVSFWLEMEARVNMVLNGIARCMAPSGLKVVLRNSDPIQSPVLRGLVSST